MATRLDFPISPQPDGSTCGPTCLQAIYRYYGDEIALDEVIREVTQLDDGGTLAVVLGCHALRRGYDALIYTYNLQLFDPTWFGEHPVDLREKLKAQMQVKSKRKLHFATNAFLEFLDLGGEVRTEDLTRKVLRRHLRRGVPILTGLSATWLYGCAREIVPTCEYDDVRGTPMGHFVVLCGLQQKAGKVLVADPLLPNPVSVEPHYAVGLDRLISAILLGILTYDANLLVITPRKPSSGVLHVDPDRRQQSR